MRVCLVKSNGRMAPCFPGVEMEIFDAPGTGKYHETISTQGWDMLSWGRELFRRDVTALLCGGIDMFLRGSLNGYGIDVFPGITGNAEKVMKEWQSGKSIAPPSWPAPGTAGPAGAMRGGGRRRRFRGGRH